MECCNTNANSRKRRPRRQQTLFLNQDVGQQLVLNNNKIVAKCDDDISALSSFDLTSSRLCRPMPTRLKLSKNLSNVFLSIFCLTAFISSNFSAALANEDELFLSFAAAATTNVSSRSSLSRIRLSQRHGFVPAFVAQTSVRHNIMPADVPLIEYNINFENGQAARFNFPNERDVAPAFEKRQRPASASNDPNSSPDKSQPSRRALAPQLLNQLDSALVDNIARRVLPQVQSDLHIEEGRAIASLGDGPEQRSDLHALNARAALEAAAANRNLTERQNPPPRFLTPADENDAAEDEPVDGGSPRGVKTTRDMTRVFAKPTLKSVQLMRLAAAMEEMTRAMKQQLQLTNEDVAVVLPQVDLHNTSLGPMVTMGDIPRGKLNFDGLPSNVQNFGDNDLASARQFVRKLNNADAEEFFVLAAQQQQQHMRVKRQSGGCQRSPFRSADGSCNNLAHSDWGRSFIPFKRYIVTPHYADGVSEPRTRSYNEQARRPNLPGARLVSSIMHDGGDSNDDNISLMTAQFGQFLDHDMTHTPISAVNDRGQLITPRCCGQRNKHNSCFEINVPRDDPFFSRFQQGCLEFVRSSPANTRLGPREQLNQLTSILDGSVVYGSTADQARGLRNFKHGELSHVFRRETDEELLPNDPGSVDCSNADPQSGRVCFKAGDVRSNEQMGVTVMQTMFLRLHNQVARALSQINPHWNDERAYQETRKIVGALLQHVSYNEYLPVVLGRDHLERFNLLLKRDSHFDGYDENRNPTIANVFAAAAYRFGHTLVQGTLFMMDPNHRSVLSQNLKQSFFSPFILHQSGRNDQVIRGLCDQNIQRFDRKVDEQVTNHLFESPGAPFGHDLAARNIARGRDHGLPGYNFWRKWCGLPVANTWEDLNGQVASDAVDRLKRLYDNPSDVDLWTAGISELPVAGGLVGPTFACIIGQQFQDLRVGDRYWYENPAPEGFSLEQLQQLRLMTLARVICDTTNTVTIQKHVMLKVMNENGLNPMTDCKTIPFMDLSKWKEDVGGGGQPSRRQSVIRLQEDQPQAVEFVPTRDNFDSRILQQQRPIQRPFQPQPQPFNSFGGANVPSQFTQTQPFGGGGFGK